MNALELLRMLRRQGVRLRAQPPSLVVDAPSGVLSDDLRSAIASHKAELLDLLQREHSGDPAGEPSIKGIRPMPRHGPFPMSSAQRRLWYLEQLQPNSGAYNISTAFRIRGPVDLEAMKAALRMLVDRHEALRTTLRLSEGVAIQEILEPGGPIDLEVVEGSGDSDGDEETALREEAGRPFDLETGPLFRVRLWKRSQDDHTLLLAAHHSVLDGASEEVLVQDLRSLYEGLISDDESPSLPSLRLQYPDYAVWEQDRLESGEFEKDLDYWREILGGPLPVLELPTDRPRPANQTFAGDVVRFQIDPTTTASLASLAREEGASLFMVALAAFKIVLSRYSGQTDVIVGFPSSLRSEPELDGMVGMLVNTTPLRTNLTGSVSFKEALGRVRDATLGALSHGTVPFEQIVEAIQPERDLSRTPIFQAILGFLEGSDEPIPFGEAVLSRLEVASGSSRTDLSLWLRRGSQGLSAELEFNVDLFDREFIEEFAQSYQTVVRAAVEDPSIPVDRLSLLPPERRRQLVEVWNDTGRDYDLDVGIHGLLEAQASRTPDRVAVRLGTQELTYGELDRRSNQFAYHLGRHGVAPGALVGLAVGRSVDMLVALLGILKAGGAYLPLDPDYPSERLQFMLEDSGATLLVTEAHLADRLPARDRVVLLDGGWTETEEAAGEPPKVPRSGKDLAYVIYTSGSTGKPKGVRVPHGAVVNFLRAMAERPGLGEDDVLVAVTTLSFDIAVLEFYLPLCVGGRVVVAPKEVIAGGRQLLDLIRTEKATVVQGTPATWRLLVEAGWEGDPSLKVLVGGEALPPDLAEELSRCSTAVWNMYGPTETTVWSTCWKVKDPQERILIGRPIANTQIYILDDYLEPVPPGVVGELYIGGDGVTQGYLNRPELTEERFVPDPFHGQGEGRMYRTGDLARYRWDGEIEFLGRVDNQVKVRGFRIELGEIEAMLRGLGGVQDTAVAVHEEKAGDQRLVAYVVVDPMDDPTPTEMRRHLRAQLPEYMVPHHYVEIGSVPLTPNGKVDRAALALLFAPVAAPASESEPPGTETEKLIAEIWKDVLGVETVGVHDNFFDLGGHSLLALRVLGRIEAEVGRELSPRLMIFQTLKQIAQELEGVPA